GVSWFLVDPKCGGPMLWPGSVQSVNFDHRDAGLAVRAPEDRGVTSTVPGKRFDQCRLEIVGRSDPGLQDLALLAAGAPVIIGADQPAICISKLESRIGEFAGDVQRWTDRADDHLLRSRSENDRSRN